MEEVWKDIPGYEGLYQVSSLGQVRSLNYRGWGKIAILKLKKTHNGYLSVGLFKEGKQKYFFVHRLVALAFIPNPNNLSCVNHKDEDKTNNCVDNLEWCDQKYNNNYGTAKERISKSETNCPSKCIPIFCYDLSGTLMREFISAREAERILGVSNSNIAQCCKGRVKTAGGYIWKYKEAV